MGKKQSVCYFHKVKDPNETHYDPEKHHICFICAVKLWEIAQWEIEFEVRGQIVTVGVKGENSKKQTPK